MRKILLGFALLLVICVAAYVRIQHAKHPLEVAYAGNRQVTLQSAMAQVHEPVAIVNFGDRLEVLQRYQDQVQVRTMAGVAGWVSEHDLLSADLWQKAGDLEVKAAAMPVQARGHTRSLSNLHIEAGREAARIRQVSKGVPVGLLERESLETPNAPSANEEEVAVEPSESKKEDWWLVQVHPADQNPLAGWILGRLISLDVPPPLPDYASSAVMRIVGWFELNRVADASGKPKPQYLVVGTHGPEGQPCDFTLMRVYTWGAKRQRYETAFVKSNICGKLPVRVRPAPARGSEVAFSFDEIGSGEPEDRTYVMRQTVVRLLKAGGQTPRRRAH